MKDLYLEPVRYFMTPNDYPKYTVFRKKTPTHIFFHIFMNDMWI